MTWEIYSSYGATISSGFLSLRLSKPGRVFGSGGTVDRHTVWKQKKACRANPCKWCRWTTAQFCSCSPSLIYLILFLFPFWCNCYTFQQPMEGTIGRKSSWISSASPNPAWICCLLPRDPAACFFLQVEKVRNFLRSGFCIQSLLHSHSQYKGKYSCSGYTGICTHLWTLKYVKESCVTPLNGKERAQWGKQKTEGSSEEKFSLAHCQFTKKYRSSAAAFHTTSTAHQFPFLLLPEFIYQTHVCIYIFAFPLVQLRVGPGKTADANIKLLTAASSSCTCKKGQHYPSLRMQAPHATSAGSKGIDLYHHHLV